MTFQLIGLVIMIPVVIFFFINNKKRMAEAEKQYANFRLADVAQRTGLSIVEGDPNFNLMMAHAHHAQKDYQDTGGFIGKLSGDGTKETRAVMRGAPNGRLTEFVYYCRTDVDRNLGGRGGTITTTFECRLSVQAASSFPPFQIVLRNPAPGMAPRQDDNFSLPPLSFGDPMLDAKLILTGADPRLGAMLAPLAYPLIAMGFVQIRGANQVVTSHTTEMASSISIYSMEQMQLVLEQIAAVMEGRPAPAMQAAPTGYAQPAR